MVKKPWRIATLVLSLVLALSLAAAARATASISKDSPDPLLVTPANPTELDTIHFTISGIATSFCPPLFSPPVLRGTDIVLYGVNPAFPVNPSCQGAWTRELSIPPLPPGTYRVEVVIDPNLYATQTLVVTRATPPPAILTVDPRLPTTSDPITLSATVATNCPTAFGIPLLLGSNIVLQASVGPVQSCSGPTTGHSGQATIGPLPAGAYIVSLEINGQVAESQGITVTAPTTTLPLVGDRFAVTLTRSAPSPGGPGFAVPLTDESGYFWFFDASNIEVTVKILDGRPVNGHYWVFVASMTNLPYTLTIQDLGSSLCGASGAGCPVKVYTTKPGENRNFLDVGSL